MEFMILLAVDDVTEIFPRFGSIFEQPVRDSKAIVVRLSRDIYSTVSFTYQSVSSRDKTLIIMELLAARVESYGLLRMFC
jgi:hypothetical protein